MKKPLLVKVTLEGDHIFINIGNAEGGVGYGIPNTPQAIQQEAIQFDANPGQDETVHGITFPAHLKPQVAHDLRKLMPKITLPVYGITIDGSTITSNLKDGGDEHPDGGGAVLGDHAGVAGEGRQEGAGGTQHSQPSIRLRQHATPRRPRHP